MTAKGSRRRQFGSLRKLPSGRWQARYKHPLTGALHTGPLTYATKTDAARYLAVTEADLERGSWRDPRRGKINFADWSTIYLERALHKRATTLVTNRAALRSHLLPAFGSMSLAEISRSQVSNFVQSLVSKGLASSTIHTVYGLLRAIMNSAVEDDLILASPCRRIKLPPASKGEVRFITVEQLVSLADEVPENYRLMIYLAGVLGLRWSEIAGLRVGRVDFLRRTLTVAETASSLGGFADVKTKSSRRTLNMPDFLVEMVAVHCAQRNLSASSPSALLFTAPRGGQLFLSNWHRSVWKPAIKSVGLQGFHFHGLRHTSVALMVGVGTHAKIIQQRLGHSSFVTTMDVYGHFFSSADDGVTDRLNALYAGHCGTQLARTSVVGVPHST